jgi:hypothetical protein
LVFSRSNRVQFGNALPVRVSNRFTAGSAVFDDDHLVSFAGLVPVLSLAAQTGLPALLADKITIAKSRIKSGSANPAPKLATLIAAMCAGADSIDDVNLVRCGGMKTLFDAVYAADDRNAVAGVQFRTRTTTRTRPCCATSSATRADGHRQ